MECKNKAKTRIHGLVTLPSVISNCSLSLMLNIGIIVFLVSKSNGEVWSQLLTLKGSNLRNELLNAPASQFRLHIILFSSFYLGFKLSPFLFQSLIDLHWFFRNQEGKFSVEAFSTFSSAVCMSSHHICLWVYILSSVFFERHICLK